MTSVLAGLTPARFLRDFWQRRPLLVRQALPGFAGIVDRDAMLALAARPDAVSRLVIDHGRERGGPRRGGQRWERHDGPLELDAAALPARDWTLLVHGVESLVPGGWELLRRFDFIAAARVDDLMVSYAAPGGSVGPHDDLYDVFLLQGPGRRRWRIARGGSRALDEQAAIKVLRDFDAEEEWLLEPGDMLYLPPGVAHYGVAEGPCFTYSIGFLAPSHLDLMQSFLGYLAGAVAAASPADAATLLADPVRRPATRPLAIADAMVREVARVLDGVRWDRRVVEDFLGCFLTRPKPHVRFTPPRRPLERDAWSARLRQRGRLRLHLATRGLVRAGRAYLNGEAHAVDRSTLSTFESLVLRRTLELPQRGRGLAALTYDAYRAGWLGVG